MLYPEVAASKTGVPLTAKLIRGWIEGDYYLNIMTQQFKWRYCRTPTIDLQVNLHHSNRVVEVYMIVRLTTYEIFDLIKKSKPLKNNTRPDKGNRKSNQSTRP